MNYLLGFLGLLGVAVILAASPLVIRLIEYLFPILQSDGLPAKAPSPQAAERSEIRDEIRRLTTELETDGSDARRTS